MPATTSSSAKRYAEAVFDIAKSQNSFDRWGQDLTAMTRVLDDPELSRLLSSPAVALTVKEAILAKALPGLSTQAANLAKLLLRRGRFALAPQLDGYYRRMLNEYRGIAIAEVVSAVPLNDDELESVASRLSAMTSKKVIVEPVVDPSIIGGIVARIGDQLLDASVKGRLEALKKRLAAQ